MPLLRWWRAHTIGLSQERIFVTGTTFRSRSITVFIQELPNPRHSLPALPSAHGARVFERFKETLRLASQVGHLPACEEALLPCMVRVLPLRDPGLPRRHFFPLHRLPAVEDCNSSSRFETSSAPTSSSTPPLPSTSTGCNDVSTCVGSRQNASRRSRFLASCWVLLPSSAVVACAVHPFFARVVWLPLILMDYILCKCR